jgi:hypothetical protein
MISGSPPKKDWPLADSTSRITSTHPLDDPIETRAKEGRTENGCHKASGKPYLRPMVPTEPGQSIINFDAAATWPE